MKMKKLKSTLIMSFIFSVPLATSAATIPIDLNDFYSDPTVSVSPSGDSANMFEDSGLGSVLLSNDPFFGEPGITVPSNLVSLQFDYNFIEPINNDDIFYALVFDGVSGDLIDDFTLDITGSGSIVWNLATLSPSTTLLGLEFQLNASIFDVGLDSAVFINIVQLETSATVPTPNTLILLGVGLFGVLSFQRKRILS